MNSILAWVMSILGAVILSIIADLTLSNKRMGKFVSGVLSSIVVLTIISPLPGLIKGGSSSNYTLFHENIEVDSSTADYISNKKFDSLSTAAANELSKNGFHHVRVVIEGESYGDFSIKNVTIYLYDLVMDEKITHIDKYGKITELVCGYLGVEERDIKFYG